MFRRILDKFIITNSKIKQCSFCNCSENDKNPLVTGDSAYICSNCILTAYRILFEELEDENICINYNCLSRYEDIDFLAAIRKEELKGGQ